MDTHTLTIKLAGDIGDLLGKMQSAERTVGGSMKSIESAASSAMKMIGGLAAGVSVGALVGKLVSVQREFDVLNSSLITVSGGSANAAREMEWIKQFAKDTPFGLAQATQGFVKMKALGLDPSMASLTSYGNTASAMGKDLNQMVEAVADAATGEFERLKEFGIKASKQGSDVSLTFQGVTTKIGNNAQEITGYLEAIGNHQFAGAMAERAKTLDGTISALGDTWDELFRTINDQNAGSLIFDAVTLATGAIEEAIVVINAMSGASSDAAQETGALATAQEFLGIAFETIAALAANVKYVLVGVGRELGGLAAQAVALATLDFAAAGAIGDAMKADAAAARIEVDATTARILAARQAAEELSKWNTRNASAANDARRLDLAAAGASGKGAKSVDSKAIDAANKAMAEQAKLLAELSGLSGSFYEDWEARNALYRAGKISVEQLTQAQAELLAKQPAIAAANKEQAEATKLIEKAQEEAIKASAQYYDGLGKGLTTQEETNQKLRESNEEIGLTTEALGALQLARMDATIALEEYNLAQANSHEASALDLLLMQKRIDKLKEERSLTSTGATKKAAYEAVQASTKAWEKGWDETDKLARETFTSWAVEGGSAAEKIGKSLETALLSAIYEATLKPVAFQLYTSVMGGSPGAGSTSGGITGAMNTASNLNSVYGAVGQYFTGASVGASAASLAGANAVGAVGGDALGALIAGNGSWAGVAVGAEAAAGTAAATGAAAGASTGVAAGLAAIPVWGWVALAGVALLSMSGGPKSTSSTGYGVNEYGADGSLLSSSTDSGGIGEAAAALDSINASFQGVLKSLGATGGAKFTYNSNTGKEGEDPQFYIKSGSYDSGEIQKNADNVALATSRAIFTALQDSTLPKYLEGAFDGMVAGSLSADDINGVLSNAQALKVFNDQLLALPFANLADLSFAATQSLIGFSGGLDGLKTNLASYYTNFYSSEEQRAQTIKNINEATAGSGLDAATASRDQFRAIVEAQDLTTESGRQTYAALLGVSGAFAGLTPAAADTSKALEDAATAAEKLATTNQGWADQLAVLTGAETERSIALRDAGDDTTRALMAQVYAQEDLNDAAVLAAEATQKLSESWAELATMIPNTIAKFKTPEQNRDAQYTSIATGLKDYGFATGDLDAIVAQLKGANKDTILAVGTLMFDGLANTSTDAAKALVGFVDTLAGIKDEEAALTVSTDTAESALSDLSNTLDRFGGLNLNFDLTSQTGFFGGLQGMADSFDATSQDVGYSGLELAKKLSLYFNSASSGLASAADELEKTLIASGTGIGENLALNGLADYFTGFANDLNTLVVDLTMSLSKGSASLDPALVSRLAGQGYSLEGLGIGKDALTGAGTVGITGAVATAAGQIGTALTKSLMDGISDEVKGNTAFSDLLGTDLAKLSAIIGGVGKDDVQGLNDAFLLLTGSLSGGKLTSDQYTAAIGLVTDAFTNGAEAAGTAAETIQQAYDRLRNPVKTNEGIAQERITLEDELRSLTDTSTQALTRQRDALDASNQGLFDQIQLIKGQAAALEEAKTGTNDALSAVQRAVDAQKTTLNTQLEAAQSLSSEVGGIFDTLKSAVQDLYGSVENAAQQSAAQARSFISSALLGAQATGSLPDGTELQDAIQAATAGIDAGQYASSADLDYERLVLANQLDGLKGIAGVQLSEAERQIKVLNEQLTALDGVLDAAQQQVDVMRGIDVSVLSVADAVNNLATAIAAETFAKAAAGGVLTDGAVGGKIYSPAEGEAMGYYGGVKPSDVYAAVAASGSNPADQALAALTAGGYNGGGLDTRIFDEFVTSAGYASSLDVPGYIDFLRKNNVPGFASGGMHSGGLRVVGENGWEVEATGQSRIWNQQQLGDALRGGSNDAEIVAELRALRAEFAQLRAATDKGNESAATTADVLVSVKNGSGLNMVPAPTF